MRENELKNTVFEEGDGFSEFARGSIIDYINLPDSNDSEMIPSPTVSSGCPQSKVQSFSPVNNDRHLPSPAPGFPKSRNFFSQFTVSCMLLVVIASFGFIALETITGSAKRNELLSEKARLDRTLQDLQATRINYLLEQDRAAQNYETFKTVIDLRTIPGFQSEFIKLPAPMASKSQLEADRLVKTLDTLLKTSDPRSSVSRVPERPEIVVTGTADDISNVKQLLKKIQK